MVKMNFFGKGSRKKGSSTNGLTPTPSRTWWPSELLVFKKVLLSLMARPFPPPLNGQAINTGIFIAASLTRLKLLAHYEDDEYYWRHSN